MYKLCNDKLKTNLDTNYLNTLSLIFQISLAAIISPLNRQVGITSVKLNSKYSITFQQM